STTARSRRRTTRRSAWATCLPKPRRASASSSASRSERAELSARLDETVEAAHRLVDLRHFGPAGLRHVGAPAAGAAEDLRHGLDELAGLVLVGERLAHGEDERRLGPVHRA